MMLLPIPLVKGTLIKRYKRFLADVILDCGTAVTAHCANPGSMLGLQAPDSTVWLSKVPLAPQRKLQYSWELMSVADVLVGINTTRANKIVEEAIINGRIPELAQYSRLRREVKYGHNSRIDILLENDGDQLCYVEVKNVHLKLGDYAAFPDAVTQRGAKHQLELANVVKAGHRAIIFYLVQRPDCRAFRLAEEIDPAYTAAAQAAKKQGVEVLCYQCHITLDEITLDRALQIERY